MAVKVIDKVELYRVEDRMHMVDREIEIMMALRHPNIVRLEDIYDNPTEVCLVMELAQGGDLHDVLANQGTLSEHRAAKIFCQLLDALSELHSKKIVHRDLKPENILMASENHILLADFGLSSYECERLQGDDDLPLSGTTTYMAPEALAETNRLCVSQDLWSSGVILYILLSGSSPFPRSEHTLESIVRGQYSLSGPGWDRVSWEAKDLITQLLCLDPAHRISAQQARQHPWITQHMESSHQQHFYYSIPPSLLEYIPASVLEVAKDVSALSSNVTNIIYNYLGQK